MKRFAFQFASLLVVRRNHRDVRQRALAEASRRVAEIEARRQQVIRERTEQLDQMRQLGTAGKMDVDAAARRRYFASQLVVDLARLDHERSVAEQAERLCQAELIKADQAVKVLENLEEKQRTEFLAVEEAKAQRELEDAWQGTGYRGQGSGIRD